MAKTAARNATAEKALPEKVSAKTPRISKFIDEEERDLVETLDSDDAPFKSHLTAKRRRELQAMAQATMNDEREKITIRISKRDLERLKSRALQEGLPYQTLIGSILHKAVS